MTAIGATGSASPPDFNRKILAPLFGCLVDDLAAGVMSASGVLKGGLGVLREGLSSGVVLVRPFSSACSRHLQAKDGIATLTQPS